MILNFYEKIKVFIDEDLVNDRYYSRFEERPFSKKEPKYKLFIKKTKQIDTSMCIDVSVYMKYSKKDIFIIDKNGKVCQSLFGKFDLDCATIYCESGFDSLLLYNYVLKPFLRYSFIKCDMAFIHSSSFELYGKKYLIVAWAHTGKTAMLLSALKAGADFLGDDISILSASGELFPYVVPINLFEYNLKNNNLLKRHLTFMQWAKMHSAKILATVFYLMQKLSKSSKMKHLFYAGKTFFEECMHVSVFADQIFLNSCNSKKGPITKALLLERGENTQITKSDDVSLELFANRLQQCINYEFQRFNEIATTARWTPYYKGDNSLELKEKDIYLRCFQGHQIRNVVITKNQNFDKLLQEIISDIVQDHGFVI